MKVNKEKILNSLSSKDSEIRKLVKKYLISNYKLDFYLYKGLYANGDIGWEFYSDKFILMICSMSALQMLDLIVNTDVFSIEDIQDFIILLEEYNG